MKKYKLLFITLAFVLMLGTVSTGFIYAADTETKPEKITLKGNLVYENRMHPEVLSNGKTYEIMLPRFVIFDLKINNNDAVEIEGFVDKNFRRFNSDANDSIVIVTKLVYNGKTIDVEKIMQDQNRGCRGRGYYDGNNNKKPRGRMW